MRSFIRVHIAMKFDIAAILIGVTALIAVLK